MILHNLFLIIMLWVSHDPKAILHKNRCNDIIIRKTTFREINNLYPDALHRKM